MRLPGRMAAAIEVLADVEAHRRPVAEALKAWGLANRFAGAGDRAAIGNLVYDALRRRSSHAWAMGSDAPRALVLSVAVREWGEPVDRLNADFSSDRFAPTPVSDAEARHLTAVDPLSGAPDHVRGDVPEWTVPLLQESFGASWIEEAQGLAGRPPLDLRVNTLKSSRERMLRSLDHLHPDPEMLIPNGIRFAAGVRDSRTPNVQIEEGFLTGGFEVQDFGSQIVATLAGARGNEQVLDFCAGAGGKTLAMAAAMQNRGQIFAFDSDRARLAPIYDRLKRSGVRNVQVRPPKTGALDDLVGKLDRVVVDAPCTGTGTWRRQPTAKWKLTSEQLAARVEEQRGILVDAARFLKPGGTLVYITCSVLPEENGRQAEAFLAAHPDFAATPGNKAWMAHFSGSKLRARFSPEGGVALSPLLTGTDGFYLIQLQRS
ncbi:MAG: RsmB/NOP family class I SAM-dependent RNA methyltransferase [Devosia sp.]|nr:RsmB/NOP family class I SAM-dependent RNA methyltransferase [Devosia sp.]